MKWQTLLSLVILCAPLAAAEFYVSSDGDDKNGNGYPSRPFKTLLRAYKEATRNREVDTIYLRRGDTFTASLTRGRKIRSVRVGMKPLPDEITFTDWGPKDQPRPIWKSAEPRGFCLRTGRLVFHVRNIHFKGYRGVDAQVPGCSVDNCVFECNEACVAAWTNVAAQLTCTHSILNGKRIDFLPDQRMVYHLDVPKTGWYRVSVKSREPIPPSIGYQRYNYRLTFPGGEQFWHHQTFPVYLRKGQASVQVESRQLKDYLDFTLTSLEPTSAKTAWLFRQHHSRFFTPGEQLPLRIRLAAPEPTDVTVEATTPEGKTLAEETLRMEGEPQAEMTLSLPLDREGQWNVRLLIDGKPVPADPVKVVVIDDTPLPKSKTYQPLGEGTLIAAIDCTAEPTAEKTYVGSEDVKVVTGPAGRYRQAGGGGAGSGHAPGANSYFGYKLTFRNPGKLHKVVLDYPDDACRSFLIHMPSQYKAAYPWNNGVGTGGIHPLSNRMQTREVNIWPRGKVAWLMIHSWRRNAPAAVGRIRVYEYDGELPPLPVGDADRYYGIYYEEPRAMEWGSVISDDPGGYVVSDDPIHYCRIWRNLFSHMRHVGQNLLWYPVMAYNVTTTETPLLQSLDWRDKGFEAPQSFRGMLMTARKYHARIIAEFHAPYPRLEGEFLADLPIHDQRQIARDGSIANFKAFGDSGYNFLHPQVRKALLAGYREMMTFYADSPAFMGIALRNFGWAYNVGFAWPKIDWGYGDVTVARFEKDTGIDVPVTDDPDDLSRFQKRYDFLTTEAREAWLAWRREQVNAWVAELAGLCREVRPDLQLVLPAWKQPNPDRGVYPRDWAKIDNVIVTARRSYNKAYADYPFPVSHTQNLQPWDVARNWAFGPAERAGMKLDHPYMEGGNLNDFYPAWLRSQLTYAGTCGAPECPPPYPLERFADLASTSPPWLLADGSLTHESVIIEQRQVYGRFIRSLPNVPFTPARVNVEPVFLLTGSQDAQPLLVVANRQDYAVKLTLAIDGQGDSLRRLADGKTWSLNNGEVTLTVKPFAMMGLALPQGARLAGAEVQVPPEQLRALQTMLDEAEAIVGRCDEDVNTVTKVYGRRVRASERPEDILGVAREQLRLARQAMENRCYDTAERYVRGYVYANDLSMRDGFALPIVYGYLDAWPSGVFSVGPGQKPGQFK